MAGTERRQLRIRSVNQAADGESAGSSWIPSVALERTPDGRPVFVYRGTRYVEVPLGSNDIYRFLAELRTEMAPADFHAYIDRNRGQVSPVVLWRLGLEAVPGGGTPTEVRSQVDRARDRLRQTLRAA